MAGIISSQPIARVTKLIQRSTISLTSAGSNTATITSIDTAKSELRFLGYTSTINDLTYSTRVALTNATTVTATRNNGGADTTVVSFEVTENY